MKQLLALLLFVPSLCVAQLPDYVPQEGLLLGFTMDSTLLPHNQLAQPSEQVVGYSEDRFGQPAAALDMAQSEQPNIYYGHIDTLESMIGGTISAWCYLTDLEAYNHVIQNRDINENYHFILSNNNSGVYAYYGTLNDSLILTSTLPPLNQWFMLTMTSECDGGSSLINLYMDLTPIATASVAGCLYSSPLDEFFIGGSYTENTRVDGILDDLYIWNRVLSFPEINSLFLGTSIQYGCLDSAACNYDVEANTDDSSCEYGCIYCGEGTVWDSTLAQCVSIAPPCAPSCGEGTVWDPVNEECIIAIPADLNYDGCVSVNDLLVLLAVHGTCPPYPEWPDEPTDTTWTCGDPVNYWDYDHETVVIGDHCWFAENLRTTKFLNGEVIPADLSDAEWLSISTPATAVYGEGDSWCQSYSPTIDDCNPSQALSQYGRLYSWHTVADNRGLCPSGWTVPTDAEWSLLESSVNPTESSEPTGLSLMAESGWCCGPQGTDTFGFSALPGGYRGSNGDFNVGGLYGHWWTATSENDWAAWSRRINGDDQVLESLWLDASYGFSIRCIRETTLSGCTDSLFLEFNFLASEDDGSCLTPVVSGCMDSLYLEFDPNANVDDGSCLTPQSEGSNWSCGDSLLYQNYWYNTTQIGDQCWFSENLRAESYRNGDSISEGTTDFDWIYSNNDLTTDGKTCSITLEFDTIMAQTNLYNLYSVIDERGVCPPGWSVPSKSQCESLFSTVSNTSAALISIEADTAATLVSGSPFWGGTNTTGFSLIPFGGRNIYGGFFEPYSGAYVWTNTLTNPDTGDDPRAAYMTFEFTSQLNGGALPNNGYARSGHAIRCIQD